MSDITPTRRMCEIVRLIENGGDIVDLSRQDEYENWCIRQPRFDDYGQQSGMRTVSRCSACVNFCQGFSNDALEATSLREVLGRRIAE